MTEVNVKLDTKSMLLSDLSLSNQYVTPCNLFVFGNPTISSGVISQSPDDYGSFNCSNGTNAIIQTTIPFNSTETTALFDQITAGNTSFSIMVFPTFNSTMRSGLDASSYKYAIGNYQNQLHIVGDGFYCMWIRESNMCNLYYEPWEAVKDALGQQYIGDWFYVLMFFPIPMAVFLSTRNGAYAGFTSLSIMLVIETIDPVVFEIALSMVLISAGFGFYEVIRKRIFE